VVLHAQNQKKQENAPIWLVVAWVGEEMVNKHSAIGGEAPVSLATVEDVSSGPKVGARFFVSGTTLNTRQKEFSPNPAIFFLRSGIRKWQDLRHSSNYQSIVTVGIAVESSISELFRPKFWRLTTRLMNLEESPGHIIHGMRNDQTQDM
jgi:hypothetical protein